MKTFIYIISVDKNGPFLIGLTSNIETKIKKIQKMNHEKIDLVASFEGDRIKEECLLYYFRSWNLHDQWFSWNKELNDLILEIKMGKTTILEMIFKGHRSCSSRKRTPRLSKSELQSKIKDKKKLAEELKVSVKTIENWANFYGITHKKNEKMFPHKLKDKIDEIYQLYNQNWTYREIADKFGTTISSIGKAINKISYCDKNCADVFVISNPEAGV